MHITLNASENDPSLPPQLWPPWIVQLILGSLCVSLLMFSFADFRRRRHRQFLAKMHRLSKKRRFHMLTQEYFQRHLDANCNFFEMPTSPSTDDPMQMSTCTHISTVSGDYESATSSLDHPRPSSGATAQMRLSICRYDCPEHDAPMPPPSPSLEPRGPRIGGLGHEQGSRAGSSFLMMNFRRQQTQKTTTVVSRGSAKSQAMQMTSFPDYF